MSFRLHRSSDLFNCDDGTSPDSFLVDVGVTVGRAELRAANLRSLRRWLYAAFAISLVAIFGPVHTWFHAHLQFFWGVLVGSCVQAVPWARDRLRWMKWFSWQ